MGLTDRAIWASAQQVIKQCGAKAPLHCALRIAELATAGDKEGVQTWQAIAAMVDHLIDFRTGEPLSRQ